MNTWQIIGVDSNFWLTCYVSRADSGMHFTRVWFWVWQETWKCNTCFFTLSVRTRLFRRNDCEIFPARISECLLLSVSTKVFLKLKEIQSQFWTLVDIFFRLHCSELRYAHTTLLYPSSIRHKTHFYVITSWTLIFRGKCIGLKMCV